MSDEKFITLEPKLPNHCNELSKAEEALNKLKYRFKIIEIENSITDKKHEFFYEEIVRVLDYVGRLSISAFTLETSLEETYLLKYKRTPKLAKQLWLEHYKKIHHPYNILKNRCFRMLDELDEEYIRVFDKKPSNWKI